MNPKELSPVRLHPRAGPTRVVPRGDLDLARMAKALAHPARIAILRILLTRGECICGDLVNRLPLAQATVSQHLKVLKEAGWIQGEIDGPRVCYCANAETGRRFQSLLQPFVTATQRRES